MMKYRKIGVGFLLISIVFTYSFKDRFFEIAKQIEIYNNVFKTLNINYIDEINPGDLTNKAINNTLKNLDPYTVFYNEQQVEDVKIRRAGEYAGIGISTWYLKQGIVIRGVREGHPADKAGLKSGDVITDVNGQSLYGMERDQLSQVLKGVPNTSIAIKLLRGLKVLDFNLKLDKIAITAVPFFDMIDDEVGYIKLNSFIRGKSTQEVRSSFIALEKRGMKKLVFDLRYNPGGSLNDAINITNLFIEKNKKVVETKGKLKENSRVYKTKNLPLSLDVPVVVLINGRSASASEIVSGSLQDYDRGVVLGERSFGKGLVQRYFKLNYGTQMKATISKYYTPSGRCIQELDYANRDLKTGKIPKFSEGNIRQFKTLNGRIVYDGGGVTPDIKIGLSKVTQETKTLLESRSVFNFATKYVRNHSKPKISSYKFSDSDFKAFKNYLIQKDTVFVTKQEALFKKAYNSVKEKKRIGGSYSDLILRLKRDKVAKISKNKDRIVQRLTEEILKQYFYEKGLYQHQIKHNNTIKKAVDLLKNTNKYNKILKN